MANLFGDIDWCWGSLKPWQLLHSKLAEKERYGSMMDVWELIDQTLGSDLTRFNKRREASGHDRRRSHGGLLLQLLGEDGEYWSHGGVMEAQIREGLVRSWDEDNNNNSANNQRINDGSDATVTGGDDQVRYCTAASSWRTETEEIVASESAQVEWEAEQGETGDGELVAESANSVRDQIEEEEEEEEDSDDEEEIYYENDEINSVVLVQKCCSSAIPATNTTKQEVAPNLAVSDKVEAKPPNLAEAAPLDLADTAPLCPVCLEKLALEACNNNGKNDSCNYEGQINEDNNEGIVQLACRHVFHAECLSPWLQRQPHACCPCCRAPIPQCYYWQYCLPSPPSLAGSPPDLGAPAGHGIMRLLADVEAVLDQLGLRS